MNNIQNISNIKKSWAFLAISVLIAILFFINISAFGNSVTNAGNTNARIANPRELGAASVNQKYIDLEQLLK